LPEFGVYAKYRGRARAAAWNKYILLFFTILSGIWTCLPIGFGLESVLIALVLVGVTIIEYRVHRYFRESNPEAPTLGFRNQAFFAAVILVYCLYHAWAGSQMPGSVEVNNLIDSDTMDQVGTIVRASYLVIGVVGCISQFGLAWYYRTARVAQPI